MCIAWSFEKEQTGGNGPVMSTRNCGLHRGLIPLDINHNRGDTVSASPHPWPNR